MCKFTEIPAVPTEGEVVTWGGDVLIAPAEQACPWPLSRAAQGTGGPEEQGRMEQGGAAGRGRHSLGYTCAGAECGAEPCGNVLWRQQEGRMQDPALSALWDT